VAFFQTGGGISNAWFRQPGKKGNMSSGSVSGKSNSERRLKALTVTKGKTIRKKQKRDKWSPFKVHSRVTGNEGKRSKKMAQKKKALEQVRKMVSGGFWPGWM